MVKFSSQQGFLFKAKEFIIKAYALIVLFFLSILKNDPRDCSRMNSNTSMRKGNNRPTGWNGNAPPGGGGGGGNGGGPDGPSGGSRP